MLLSEWTKIRTVRSTVWTLLVMDVLILGLGVLLGGVADPKVKDDYVSISLIGVMIAQIAAATLGVLTIAAEYTTGMIRTTLTAHPRRVRVLVAKGLVFAGLILVVALVANTLAAVIGDAMLTSRIGDSAAKDSDFFRSVVGSSLYLAVIGLFGLGLGTLLRHSAGAITALLGIILLPMIIGPMLPSGGDKLMQYSPMFALIKLIDGGGDTGGPSPWGSLLLIAVYAGIALIAGGVRLKTRDV
ncbi:ABC transporter permease subunit [Embleya sp. NPDC059259]|uniref:ABC transporter permease subunit n=1 Tax=unclassified Embleya TaxID=2699296 RepID=UPI0036B78FE4